ncbi:MAG TPA: hypothetical protein VFF72_11745 [Caldimonas sp.]|nr:hypothetical protein [Caldimonas sp.]
MTRPPLRSLLPLVVCVTVATTTPAVAAGSCDEAYQAGIKSLQTPHHVYSTTTMPGGKTRASEAIYAGGVEYLKIGNKWQRSRMKPQDMIELAQEKMKTHPDTCTRIGDQTAGGQAVAVYKVHSNEMGTDQVVSVFKSSGLIQGTTVSLPNQSMVIRYDYANVQAPAGVK